MKYVLNMPIYRAKKIDSDKYVEFESFLKYESEYGLKSDEDLVQFCKNKIIGIQQ